MNQFMNNTGAIDASFSTEATRRFLLNVYNWMAMGLAGLKEIDGPAHDSEVPGSAKEITEQFKKTSDSFLEQVKKNYKDEDLLIEDDMYGEKWKRGLTLLYLMLHHAHHRGQMTVLMRQAGLKVTGVYGPAKEEWAAMGMDPMK